MVNDDKPLINDADYQLYTTRWLRNEPIRIRLKKTMWRGKRWMKRRLK